MFNVFMLDSEGLSVLLEVCMNEEKAFTSVDFWSEVYPHAIVDYVSKEVY